MSVIRNEPLQAIRADVESAIVAVIEAARAVGETLEDVETFVVGPRERVGALALPAVWMIPDSHVPVKAAANHAQHDLTWDFAAIVKGADPAATEALSHDIAMRVYDLLAGDPTLGGKVENVVPLEIEPGFPVPGSNNKVFASSVRFAFRIRRRE